MKVETSVAVTYRVVEESDLATFELKVNELLAAGWSLQGGVSHGLNAKLQETYCQAMMK